jgi:hypothetical protein
MLGLFLALKYLTIKCLHHFFENDFPTHFTNIFTPINRIPKEQYHEF